MLLCRIFSVPTLSTSAHCLRICAITLSIVGILTSVAMYNFPNSLCTFLVECRGLWLLLYSRVAFLIIQCGYSYCHSFIRSAERLIIPCSCIVLCMYSTLHAQLLACSSSHMSCSFPSGLLRSHVLSALFVGMDWVVILFCLLLS